MIPGSRGSPTPRSRPTRQRHPRPRGTNFSVAEIPEIDREDFRNLLAEIGKTRIPFGKFGIKAYPPAGVPIMDLPMEYLCWFLERGFPKGRLGELMAQVCEIKSVGMDSVFDPIRQMYGGRFKLLPPRRKTFDFE